MDGSFVATQLSELLGPDFLRVDFDLPAGGDAFDLISPQNIEQLRKVGRDLYQKFKPQLVKFNDGEAVRSLFIPLIRTVDSQSQPPRTFTVLLRRVGGGVKLGPVTRINVTIVPQPMYSDISNAVAISRFPGT